MNALPPFPTTTVGSWPRPPELLAALRDRRAGRLSEAGFERVADRAVAAAVASQVAAGVDLVTDGEQRRDSFYAFVADKLEGVRAMTLAELLDVVEDRAGFEQVLQTLDVPAYAITNPTCVGPVRRRAPLAADELRFLRGLTDLPVKVPLPGPYLLTRSMWVRGLSAATYPRKEDLAEDVVALLRAELAELAALGADFVQLDEPVLTELVFTQGRTRTFMCAALAARKDPAEELDFAVDLINRVVAGLEGPRIGLHVCRGNWSRNEATLLTGAYDPLVPVFERLKVRQLVLEYATPRAGPFVAVPGKELGLGVVNPRTATVEDPAGIAARVRAARDATGLAPEQLFLNPDCGFGTFARRPMAGPELAARKLAAMTEAARRLREDLA